MKKVRKLEIPTLPRKGWLDVDTVMFHACFTLMQQCIEKEKFFEMTDGSEGEWGFAVSELKELYKWWLIRKETVGNEEFNGEEEDQIMLERLIKIRQFLWT